MEHWSELIVLLFGVSLVGFITWNSFTFASRSKKKAEQGDAAMQYRLAELYGVGLMDSDRRIYPFGQNWVTAYEWLIIAEINGIENPSPYKQKITKNLTSKQIEEAEKSAKKMIEENPKLIGE